MSEAPLPPPIVRVLNLGARPALDGEAFLQAVDEARRATDEVAERTALHLPLLLGVAGADRTPAQWREALETQQAALGQLTAVVRESAWELLEHGLQRLESAAERVAATAAELQRVVEALPVYSRIPVLNHTIILALRAGEGHAEAGPALRARLADLYHLTIQLEKSAAALGVDVAAPLLDLQKAIGGIHLYLQEGSKEALGQAVTLLDRARAPLEERIITLDREWRRGQTFSGLPALERLHQGDGGALLALRDVVAGLERDVSWLDDHAWMGAEEKAEALTAMRSRLREMRAVLDAADAAGPRATAERLRELGRRFDRLQATVEAIIADRPDLSRAGHFAELVRLMEGVWSGRVPDLRLQEKTELLLRLESAFRGRLRLRELHHPEEAGGVADIVRCLDAQHQGLERILDYLESDDRSFLPQAYDLIAPATVEMLAAKETLPAAAAAGCPCCGAAVEGGAARCAACGQWLPGVGAGLDLYDGGDASAPPVTEASLPENFAFVAQVIENVERGFLDRGEARDLLVPFWNTIHQVEGRLRGAVQPAVDRLGDPDLARSQADFVAVVDALKACMADLFRALEHGGDLAAIREQIVDLAALVQQLHHEQAAARYRS